MAGRFGNVGISGGRRQGTDTDTAGQAGKSPGGGPGGLDAADDRAAAPGRAAGTLPRTDDAPPEGPPPESGGPAAGQGDPGAAAPHDGGPAGEAGAAAGEDSGDSAGERAGMPRTARRGPLRRAGAALAAPVRLAGRLTAQRQHGSHEAPGEDAAATALARLSVLPMLLLMAWLLPGLPLLLAGEFVPVPMLLIAAPLLVALVANGLRIVPSRWPRQIGGQPADRGWLSWLGLMGTVAVAAGFAAWQLVELSESAVVLRSPGAYLQAGYWLAQHGSLAVPVSLPAFGGAHAGLNFSSTGFYAHGASVVPLGTSGLPMLLAGGFWAHGQTGGAAIGPLLGGFAVLSFGGLVGRLAGPQWAPAGALVLGLTLPEQYVARSTFTETAVQVFLFGGLCLLIDALTLGNSRPEGRGWQYHAWLDWLTPQRAMMGLAGLGLGLGTLVSLDSLIYLLPVIPFAGLLIAARRTGAVAFSAGAALGAAAGIADGYLVSRPFLDALSHQMEVIGVIAAWLAALTIATVQLLRLAEVREWLGRLAARRPVRWLAPLAGLLAAAALIGLAIRPYVLTVRGAPGAVVFRYIESLQVAQGLPVDPSRTYAEDSLYWVIWYIGLPAVLLGGAGIAVLARRLVAALLARRDPARAWRNWALPLAIICAGSAAVLWSPNIVPDQPWASRRLVIIVLPGLICCGVWAAAAIAGMARRRGAAALTAAVAGLFCIGAMAVPAAATATGTGFTHTGRSGGLALSSNGLAFRRTGAGEYSGVQQLCAALPGRASVVILDDTVAQQFTQVIRGMCGVPAAWITGGRPQQVTRVLNGIAGAGRRPVLLASRPGQLAAFGGSPDRVLDLTTTQDAHQLASPPTSLESIRFVIWMLAPQPGTLGT